LILTPGSYEQSRNLPNDTSKFPVAVAICDRSIAKIGLGGYFYMQRDIIVNKKMNLPFITKPRPTADNILARLGGGQSIRRSQEGSTCNDEVATRRIGNILFLNP
jgi:hypothetical protein